MVQIALNEVSESLAEAIRSLGENDEIVLRDNHRPIARLTSLPSVSGRAKRGRMKDMIVSIAPDFDVTPEGFEEYMP